MRSSRTICFDYGPPAMNNGCTVYCNNTKERQGRRDGAMTHWTNNAKFSSWWEGCLTSNPRPNAKEENNRLPQASSWTTLLQPRWTTCVKFLKQYPVQTNEHFHTENTILMFDWCVMRMFKVHTK